MQMDWVLFAMRPATETSATASLIAVLVPNKGFGLLFFLGLLAEVTAEMSKPQKELKVYIHG